MNGNTPSRKRRGFVVQGAGLPLGMASDRLLAFLEFFDIPNKAALEAYADRVLVHRRDLKGLCEACDLAIIPIGHIAIQRHYHPPHLALSDKNLAALSRNGVGPLSADAKKTVNKVMATFTERRLFNAHFFWLHEAPAKWHLFYFDQRDTAGEHWEGGAHLHLMNHLTHPQVNAGDLLDRINEGDKPPKLSGLHLRYVAT